MNDILNLPPITVPALDYRRLMRTGRELAEQCHPLAAPLLQELHRAAVYPADEISDDVVTLDTFVTYRMGGEDTPDKRMLIYRSYNGAKFPNAGEVPTGLSSQASEVALGR
jgi:regulator of nucleoside diphosphate kinase